MSKNKYNIFRIIIYPDLTTALADNRKFGYWEAAKVKGDSRIKFGDGIKYSALTPASFDGSTFSQLPWFNSSGSAFNPPSSDQVLAVNATAALTAAQLAGLKVITSTSVAGTTITLPTATLLAAAMNATSANGGTTVGQGSELPFTVDNTAGASTVTIAVNTGIVAGAGRLTGSGTLTVAAGQIGKFMIFFKSATTALIYATL